MMHPHTKLRQVRMHPYKQGHGPTFSLTLWDTGERDSMNKAILAYRLRMEGKTIFQGEDFHTPHRPLNSDQNIEELLGFLCLKPGDTDADWFDQYTPEQLAFTEKHGEWLACEAECRFGRN